MSETNPPLQNSGYCEWQLRGLSHEPGDYPCSRKVVYEGHATQGSQGPEVVVREVRCPKILRVTDEILGWDSQELSRMAGQDMTVRKSHLAPNPNADPVDAAITGHACMEPPLEFPYLNVSLAGLRRQNR